MTPGRGKRVGIAVLTMVTVLVLPMGAAAAAPPAIRARPESEQLAMAFAAAFGGRPPVARAVGGNDIVYRPARLRWFGDRAVLVSAGTNRSDCHACAGHLAVHYLAPEGAGFRVTGAWLDGGGSADWGRPPDWRFSTLLSGQPMIRTDTGGGGQGVFCTWSRFYALDPGGPRNIAAIQTGYSNSGALISDEDGQRTEIEGTIRNVARGRSFDVAYRGSRRFTEHYVLRGGRYVLGAGETRVPEC